jgi:hypothetical protein
MLHVIDLGNGPSTCAEYAGSDKTVIEQQLTIKMAIDYQLREQGRVYTQDLEKDLRRNGFEIYEFRTIVYDYLKG